MKIAFMGTPRFAVPSFRALLASRHQVVGVVTQPDRPKGRGGAVSPSPVKVEAGLAGLPIIQPEKMKAPSFLEQLRAWNPDAIVVVAFGRILPPVILELPPHGCINVHASLLPKYRGAGPIQWALINGELTTGVTIMKMDEGMDTGDMYLQESLPIEGDDTTETLAPRLAELGSRALLKVLQGIEEGTIRAQPQNSSQVTMAPLLKKEDGLIDWGRPADDIMNQIRGMTPWPGTYTFCGMERWKVCRARVSETDSGAAPPGTILSVEKESIQVATGRGILRIFEIQPSNSRRMRIREYLSGHSLQSGIQLSGTPSVRE